MVDREGRSAFVKGRDEVGVGDVLTVRTLRGKEGGVIGRLPDGRVILFNRESRFYDQLNPGQAVEGRVTYVAQTYVIVDPLSPPKTGVEALKANLKTLTESEDWEQAVLAEALLYIIKQLERHEERMTEEW